MGLQVTLEVAFPHQHRFHLTWEGEQNSLYKVMMHLISNGYLKKCVACDKTFHAKSSHIFLRGNRMSNGHLPSPRFAWQAGRMTVWTCQDQSTRWRRTFLQAVFSPSSWWTQRTLTISHHSSASSTQVSARLSVLSVLYHQYIDSYMLKISMIISG